jgi:O-antigen ligase
LTAITHELPREAVNAKLVALISAGAISLGVLLSGFVIREPAPYELYMAGLIALWALFGLRISRTVAPLLVLLVAFNIGGMIAMTQMAALKDAPLYIAVSLFLALTGVFFAAAVERQPGLYRVIFLAWVTAAICTAALGILGYFHAFPGAEIFTKFERAAGAFQDPNVFGPFLTLPGIYLLYRLLTGSPARMALYAVPLLIIVGGIFLSFSRGAWGLFGASAALLTATLFLQSSSGSFRLRIVAMSIAAAVLLAVALLVALQIPAVSELFTARAQLVQDYDSARLGRFARFGIGFLMAMEHPFGIGPLVFGQMLGEDTHNIWLKALLDYGWLGFASYVILIGWTLAGGFRILFRNRPWQPYVLCAYVVFVGHIALGTVIDTDHWRHFYLLLGLIWGGMGLEYRHQRGIVPG